jgi:hypothetical protein
MPACSGIRRNLGGNEIYRGRGWMTAPRRNGVNRSSTTGKGERETYGREEGNPGRSADCPFQAACRAWGE